MKLKFLNYVFTSLWSKFCELGIKSESPACFTPCEICFSLYNSLGQQHKNSPYNCPTLEDRYPSMILLGFVLYRSHFENKRKSTPQINWSKKELYMTVVKGAFLYLLSLLFSACWFFFSDTDSSMSMKIGISIFYIPCAFYH
jgi:hypothetical protein